MSHKKLVMIMRNQRIFQMMKMFNLKATMESLMQQLLQRENAKKDSGLAPSKWDGKWISSQEISIFSTTKMQLRLPVNSELDHQESQHTQFWTKHLPGQESDYTKMSKRIQRPQSISKMILTKTFTIQDLLRTLSEQEKLSLITYKKSTETEEVSLIHEQPKLNKSKKNDSSNHLLMFFMLLTWISNQCENYRLYI